MLGRQVQTKEAGVDHEIGEETGAAENLIFQNVKNMNLKFMNIEWKKEEKTHISEY